MTAGRAEEAVQAGGEGEEALGEGPERTARAARANSRFALYSVLPRPNGPYITLVLLPRRDRAAFLRAFPTSAARPG